MTPRWLQPTVWTVTAVVLAAAMIGHFVVWITYITDESTAVENFLMEDMELRIAPYNSSGLVDANAPTPMSQTALEPTGLSGHDHTGSEVIYPHHRAQELEFWHHHYANDEHLPIDGDEKLYDLRAPSQLIVMYLVYFAPLLLIGIAGWTSQHWPANTQRVWMSDSWLVGFLNRKLRPVALLEHSFGGISKGELLCLVLLFAPKAAHLTWFIQVARDQWQVGMDSLYMLTGITETQYWVERLGMWFSVDFQIMDSLVHVYLGLNYATTRKWHRWVGAWILFDVLLHGALYQVLLVSDSSSLWARLHRQLAYYHGVSILAGVVAWAGAIAMLAALVPLAAFKHSSWKWVWERVHVAAGAVVVVLGVVHARKVWVSLAPGLALYGLDVALRWLQASSTATPSLSLSTFGKVLSAVVPLEEGVGYPDGGHMWLSVPTVTGAHYHAFTVASSGAHHAWGSCMLLQCKSSDSWAHDLVAGLQIGNYQKAPVRTQGPIGGLRMNPSELKAMRKLLVLSGGLGISAVLPMLKRLALYREQHLHEEDGTPQIKVFHSARSVDELILVAPLLDHPDIFDVHLFYTGGIHALLQAPHLHTLPAPLAPPQRTPLGPTPTGPKAHCHAFHDHVLSNRGVGGIGGSANIVPPAKGLPSLDTRWVAESDSNSNSNWNSGSKQGMAQKTESSPHPNPPSVPPHTLYPSRQSSPATVGISTLCAERSHTSHASLVSAPAALQRPPRPPSHGHTSPGSGQATAATTPITSAAATTPVVVPRVPAPYPPAPGPIGESTEHPSGNFNSGSNSIVLSTPAPHPPPAAAATGTATAPAAGAATASASAAAAAATAATVPKLIGPEAWEAHRREVRSGESSGASSWRQRVLQHRLGIMHGKWGSLLVWVSTWIISFGLLILGELWYNSSARAQAGLLDGAERDARRYRMAAYNVLALVLVCPTIPLILLLLARVPHAPPGCPPGVNADAAHSAAGAGAAGRRASGAARGGRRSHAQMHGGNSISSRSSSGRFSLWRNSNSSGAVLPINAPRHPLMQSHEGHPITILPHIPHHKLMPGFPLSSSSDPLSKKPHSALLPNTAHSFDQLPHKPPPLPGSEAALKTPSQSFKYSVRSAPIIVMHQRTHYTTQTTHTSPEVSILSAKSMPHAAPPERPQNVHHATMHASLDRSIGVKPVERSGSLLGTNFTSQMLSADVHAFGKALKTAVAEPSDSSHSGTFSRVFSPPRHMWNAWLAAMNAADVFGLLCDDQNVAESRTAWLERAVEENCEALRQLALPMGPIHAPQVSITATVTSVDTPEDAHAPLHGEARAWQSYPLVPQDSVSHPLKGVCRTGGLHTLALGRTVSLDDAPGPSGASNTVTRERRMGSGRPPKPPQSIPIAGRHQTVTTPGSYGGYAVGTWVASPCPKPLSEPSVECSDITDVSDAPVEDGNEATMRSMQLDAPPDTTAASIAHTNRTPTHVTSAEKTPMVTESVRSSAGGSGGGEAAAAASAADAAPAADSTAGAAAPAPASSANAPLLPVSTTACSSLEEVAPAQSDVLSHAVDVLRAAHADTEDLHVADLLPGEQPWSSQGTTERIQPEPQPCLPATLVSHATSSAPDSALPTCVRDDGDNPPETLLPVQGTQHAPLPHETSCIEDAVSHAATGLMNPAMAVTAAHKPPLPLDPLQSFALDSVQDNPTASSSHETPEDSLEGSTDDGLTFLPEPRTIWVAPNPLNAPTPPVEASASATDTDVASTDTTHVPHAFQDPAREAESSSLLSFKSAPLATDDATQDSTLNEHPSGEGEVGGWQSGTGNPPNVPPSSPPHEEDPSQVLQTVQTATGTVTRMHVRAPKTWPHIAASDLAASPARDPQGLQTDATCMHSMHADQWEELSEEAQFSAPAAAGSEDEEAKSVGVQNPEAAAFGSSSGSGATAGHQSHSKGVAGPLSTPHDSGSTHSVAPSIDSPLARPPLPRHHYQHESPFGGVASSRSIVPALPPYITHWPPQHPAETGSESLSLTLPPRVLHDSTSATVSTGAVSTGGLARALPPTGRRASSSGAGSITHAMHAHAPDTASPRTISGAISHQGTADGSVSLALSRNISNEVGGSHSAATANTGSQSMGGAAGTLPLHYVTHDSADTHSRSTLGSITHALGQTPQSPLGLAESQSVSIQLPVSTRTGRSAGESAGESASASRSAPLGAATNLPQTLLEEDSAVSTQGSITHALHALLPMQHPDDEVSVSVPLAASSGLMYSTASQSMSAHAALLPQQPHMHGILESSAEHEVYVTESCITDRQAQHQEAEYQARDSSGSIARTVTVEAHENEEENGDSAGQGYYPPIVPESSVMHDGSLVGDGSVSFALAPPASASVDPASADDPHIGGGSSHGESTASLNSPQQPLSAARRRGAERNPPGPVAESQETSHHSGVQQSLPPIHWSAPQALNTFRAQRMKRAGAACCEGILAESPSLSAAVAPDLPSSSGSGPASHSANTLINVAPSSSNTRSAADPVSHNISKGSAPSSGGMSSPALAGAGAGFQHPAVASVLSHSMHSSSGSKHSAGRGGARSARTRDATVATSDADPHPNSKSIHAPSDGLSITTALERESWEVGPNEATASASACMHATHRSTYDAHSYHTPSGTVNSNSAPMSGVSEAHGPPPSSAYMASRDTDMEDSESLPEASPSGRSASTASTVPVATPSGSEQVSEAPSMLSLTFPPTPTLSQTAFPTATFANAPRPTMRFLSPSGTLVSSVAPEHHMHAPHAFNPVGAAATYASQDQSAVLQPLSGQHSTPPTSAVETTPVWTPIVGGHPHPQPPQLVAATPHCSPAPTAASTAAAAAAATTHTLSPHHASRDGPGSLSGSAYTTRTDAEGTMDLSRTADSCVLSPLPAPHLSYDGSNPLPTPSGSLGASATAPPATDADSGTFVVPSGPASFETRPSQEPHSSRDSSLPTSLPTSQISSGSETLSAIDRAVHHHLTQIHRLSGSEAPHEGPHDTPLASGAPDFSWHPIPEMEHEASGSMSMHGEHALVDSAVASSITAALANTKRSSVTPSQLESVIASNNGTHTSSGRTADVSPVLNALEDSGMHTVPIARRFAPVQLLTAPLATPVNSDSTEQSMLHHALDDLHRREKKQQRQSEKRKVEAARRARMLQTQAVSQEIESTSPNPDAEMVTGGTDVNASIGRHGSSSATTSGAQPTAARMSQPLRSSQMHGGSTQMTSPAITDSLESVGMGAVRDLEEGRGALRAHAAARRGGSSGASPPPHPPLQGRAVRQTVSRTGIVIIHDYASESGSESEASDSIAPTDAAPEAAHAAAAAAASVAGAAATAPCEISRVPPKSSAASGKAASGAVGAAADTTASLWDAGVGIGSAATPPGAPPPSGSSSIQVVVDCSDPQRVFIRSAKPGARPIEVFLGHLDVPSTVDAAVYGALDGEPVHIWAAGPERMNLAVHEATSALPMRANVHVLNATYAM